MLHVDLTAALLYLLVLLKYIVIIKVYYLFTFHISVDDKTFVFFGLIRLFLPNTYHLQGL